MVYKGKDVEELLVRFEQFETDYSMYILLAISVLAFILSCAP
jgi:hypothetical protein